jgi:hypothetical protein
MEDDKFYPYDYFKSFDENSFNIIFVKRYVKLSYEESTIDIGKNEKEVSNGYVDLKIVFHEDKFEVYINKLIKDDISDNYVSDDYLDELSYFFKVVLDLKEENINLKNNIKNEYINLRNQQYVEEKLNYKTIEVNNYKVLFNIENNMLRLDIKK